MQEYKTFKFLDGVSSATESQTLKNQNGSELYLNVSGTFVGTVNVEGECNDVWYKMSCFDTNTLDVGTDITAPGSYAVIGIGAFTNLRVKVASYTSGEITVIGRFNY